METILFLAHRLPYPPNKGDKVRSFHFLRHLARRYKVLLGTFIDDPMDVRYLPKLRELCAEMHVESIRPWAKRALALSGLATGEALSVPYFRSRGLADWAARVAKEYDVWKAFVYSSPMAQYTLDLPRVRSIVDFVDMDSAKWLEYAQRRRWPGSALYARESRRLLAFERDVAARADASLFVTQEEARRFTSVAPESAERVFALRNGVDSEYFAPSPAFASPFPPDERPIVFTGAMDYWPNIDAAVWFARDVLPAVRKREPSARFYVVGMNPGPAVLALGSEPAVSITGRVQDVRPYLSHASVVVAPLRVARGIQNKVLEAMAMAKPVVTTHACAAPLSAQPGVELEVASSGKSFAAAVLSSMDRSRGEHMGAQARARVVQDYGWSSSLKQLDELFDHPSAQPAGRVTA